MSKDAGILHKAEFNPDLKKYILLFGSLILIVTVFGIILLPIWWIFSAFYLKRYFERLECELTTRSLRFKKGYIFHTERTIPLDKIQDLTFKEGPLLKYFGLSVLSVETAGNSANATSDLSLVGIIGASDFRKLVLDQRDKVTDNQAKSGPDDDTSESMLHILKDIRTTVQNIEASLTKNDA